MDVLFNAHDHDVFAVANTEVSFYNLVQEHDSEIEQEIIKTNLFLSKDADVKRMAWHPSFEYCNVIALGLNNGRVVLKSAEANEQALTSPYSGKEFVPKHARQCSGLAWNSHSPHWLAIGLEKHRSGSLIIWDVNSKSDVAQAMSERNKLSGSELNPSPSSQSVTARTLIEVAPGDSVNSLKWLNAETLIAGFNRKYLRIYDVRNPSTSPSFSTINHKATFGICVDPTMENRIACYGEMSIAVWDSRNFIKPAVTIPTHQSVKKIAWSPTRSNMLAALLTRSQDGCHIVPDNNMMYVYDLMNATYPDPDLEAAGYLPITRTVKPNMPDGDWITGFAWLPSSPNTLLTSSSASSFYLNYIPENTSLSCRWRNSLAVACGYNIYVHTEVTDDSSSNVPDITKIICERAKNGYGLNDDLLKNIDLCLEPDNTDLHLMWNCIGRLKQLSPPQHAPPSQIMSPLSPVGWLGHSKSRSQSGRPLPKSGKAPYFSGVYSLFKDNVNEINQATTETIPWIGVSATKNTIYTSRKRNIALMMCNWDNSLSLSGDGKGGGERFGRNSIGEGLVRRLQHAGETERACAIALWHLDMKLAIEVLNLATQKQDDAYSKYSAVAMALSGFTGVNSPNLWLDTCRRLQNELESVYLQMAFSFLVACSDENKLTEGKNGKFDQILSNKGILLRDRIAFACIYLPDVLLPNYLKLLVDDVVSHGTLEGVVVSGLSTSAGVQLLQNYINKTSDVQTALLAIVHSYDASILLKNQDVSHWKDSYCKLLNKWQMYHERVEFDLLWAKASNVQKTSSQIYVHCNYCNKSISNVGQPASQSASPSSPMIPDSRPRHNSFPLMLGLRSPRVDPTGRGGRTFMGGGLANQSSITCCPSCRKPLPRCSVCSMHMGTRHDETEFSQWMSWCMKCRHGGHQQHLLEWFKDHKQCPVTDCKCCCDSDLPTSLI